MSPGSFDRRGFLTRLVDVISRMSVRNMKVEGTPISDSEKDKKSRDPAQMLNIDEWVLNNLPLRPEERKQLIDSLIATKLKREIIEIKKNKPKERKKKDITPSKIKRRNGNERFLRRGRIHKNTKN